MLILSSGLKILDFLNLGGGYHFHLSTSLTLVVATVSTFPLSSSAKQVVSTCKISSIMVFLSFLSSPYGLTISPSMYGYNVTWSPM